MYVCTYVCNYVCLYVGMKYVCVNLCVHICLCVCVHSSCVYVILVMHIICAWHCVRVWELACMLVRVLALVSAASVRMLNACGRAIDDQMLNRERRSHLRRRESRARVARP